MPTWRDSAYRLSHLLDSRFDRLRYGLKQRLGYDDPVQVIAYDGYGNTQTLFLSGRVLEDHGTIDQSDEESLWRNLVASYRRFESDEIPGLRVQAHFQDQTVTATTDEEGYFHFILPVRQPLDPTALWHSVELTVPPQVLLSQPPPAPIKGRVLVPGPDCDFGIISDIDDTILITGATNLLTMARLTFLRSPSTRLPFNGVTAFYQALHEGGKQPRPIFYVSSSPWNLYDFLVDFMAIHQIPAGPLLLRDFGFKRERSPESSHQNHKVTQIERIMSTYPQLPFILIGDSGQHDPEAYTEIVARHPRQVLAIYIRDVSEASERDAEVIALGEKTRAHSIDLLLVADTFAAATHAAQHGYIDPARLALIHDDRMRDAAPPSPIEQAVSEDSP